MNIENWIPLYKFDDNGKAGCMTQQTYEPLVSPDGQTFCANYDWQNNYQRIWQPDRVGYTEDVVDYFFYKEIDFHILFLNGPTLGKLNIEQLKFYKLL
jgi:hypothetical protein